MTRSIGFSTGALAFGDYRRGLKMVQSRQIRIVELSALRECELRPLVFDLDSVVPENVDYVSVHAPSALSELSEEEACALLRQVAARRWPIIVHPDVITEPPHWIGLGECLCIENMDKRKSIGRTVAELAPMFHKLPDAKFCFDIGHARQVDPTMVEAAGLLRRFGSRLKQVHMSEVNSQSRHDAISFSAMQAFRRVADLIPEEIPIILESVIPEEQIREQIQLAEAVFR
jgi:hydrogenase maturation factor